MTPHQYHSPGRIVSQSSSFRSSSISRSTSRPPLSHSASCSTYCCCSCSTPPSPTTAHLRPAPRAINGAPQFGGLLYNASILCANDVRRTGSCALQGPLNLLPQHRRACAAQETHELELELEDKGHWWGHVPRVGQRAEHDARLLGGHLPVVRALAHREQRAGGLRDRARARALPAVSRSPVAHATRSRALAIVALVALTDVDVCSCVFQSSRVINVPLPLDRQRSTGRENKTKHTEGALRSLKLCVFSSAVPFWNAWAALVFFSTFLWPAAISIVCSVLITFKIVHHQRIQRELSEHMQVQRQHNLQSHNRISVWQFFIDRFALFSI